MSGILPARFPGELRDRLREIKIDLVRATARASDGLPAIPKQRRTALDSASDSHCVRSQIVAMLKVGSLQRANRASSWTMGRHHQSAPFIAFINELAPGSFGIEVLCVEIAAPGPQSA